MDPILIAKYRYLKSLTTTRPPSLDKLDETQTVINLDNQNLESIPSLTQFQIVTKVYMQNNKISTITPQSNNSFEIIELSHNLLKAIPEIGGANTISLNLSYNLIQNCEMLYILPNLCILDLSNNQGQVFSENFAESLSTFAPSLECLRIDNTGIQSLSIVHGLKLKKLSAKNNQLNEMENTINELEDSYELVDLTGNNVIKKRGFVEMLCAKCPYVRSINGKEYSDQQVEFAIAKAQRM